jgi:hypothetical protein
MSRMTARRSEGSPAASRSPVRRIAPAVLSLMLAGFYTPLAVAGVYQDDLTKCMVTATTTSDRGLLVQWIFSVAALNPVVKSRSTVTDQQRDSEDKKVEALFSRLLADNCHKESLDAVKYEGTVNVLPESFHVLGQIAMHDLMNEPNVAKGVSAIKAYFKDDERLKKLVNEANSATERPKQ